MVSEVGELIIIVVGLVGVGVTVFVDEVFVVGVVGLRMVGGGVGVEMGAGAGCVGVVEFVVEDDESGAVIEVFVVGEEGGVIIVDDEFEVG